MVSNRGTDWGPVIKWGLLVGGIGVSLYYLSRRAKKKAEDGQEAGAPQLVVSDETERVAVPTPGAAENAVPVPESTEHGVEAEEYEGHDTVIEAEESGVVMEPSF